MWAFWRLFWRNSGVLYHYYYYVLWCCIQLPFLSSQLLIWSIHVKLSAWPLLFSQIVCFWGQKKSCILKDHVAAAYYAPSIGWSFSLMWVKRFWGHPTSSHPTNQPPSQQAAAVEVMVLHMTLTLDISFHPSFPLLAGGNRVRLCTTFFEFGRWVGWWWVHVWLPPPKQAIGAELQTSLQNWQAAKFVINQSAKHTSL
jgi:hypothetical protein